MSNIPFAGIRDQIARLNRDFRSNLKDNADVIIHTWRVTTREESALIRKPAPKSSWRARARRKAIGFEVTLEWDDYPGSEKRADERFRKALTLFERKIAENQPSLVIVRGPR